MRIDPPPKVSVEIIMFSGDTLLFGPSELIRMYLHRYVVTQYILFCFFVVILDPRSALAKIYLDDQYSSVALTALSVVVGVVVFTLMALALEIIAYFRGKIRVYGPPFTFSVALTLVCFDGTVFSGAVPWPGLLMLLVYYFVLVEAASHFTSLVVAPRVLTDLRRRKAPAMQKAAVPSVGPQRVQDADHVQIGDKRIKVEALVRVMAEGNYLRVITQDERLFLPGPFGAAVDPLPEWLGVRVSRSDWVAAKAVRAIRRDGREMFVDLEDGTAVRVANSRQKVVISVLNLPVERARTEVADQGPVAGAVARSSIQTG